MNPSPMEVQVRAARSAVLSVWVHDVLAAHRAVARLVCNDAECDRLASAIARGIDTDLLFPMYDALARAYESRVTDGRQLDLFHQDHDALLRHWWVSFARSYVMGRRSPQFHRWMLAATVGLRGGADSRKAACYLLREVLESPRW